jgi:Exopolyphosphatase
MNSRLAIIDMGTNTFHLLLAETEDNGYKIIHRDRLAVKIGKDGINAGRITEEATQRALLAMQSFKNSIDQHGVSRVYAYGTSAFRNASNAGEIKNRIKKVTGIDVDIISGIREAEFIYEGVKAALDLEQDRSLIVDIGGGSVEFILGNADEILWMQSLETGAQRLLELFHKNDPITPEEITLLNSHFDRELAPVLDALKKYPTSIMVGSSGSFDTLSDIFCVKHDIAKHADEIETPLTIEGFYEIYHEVLHKDREQRLAIPGMIEMRVDMIVVACCLIRYILEHHTFNRIRVSTYSLKEGVLATFLKERFTQK